MKKAILTFCAVLSLLAIPAKVLAEVSIGITLAAADVDTKVTDDIDSNGTINTTKEITNSIGIPSLFIEAGRAGDRVAMNFGVAWIPVSATWDDRSTTQTSRTTTSTDTSGTNKGSVEISNHITAYIEPAIKFGEDTQVFVSLGLVTADVSAEVQSVSSTDKTVDLSLDGTKMGIGIKRPTGMGFIKLEYSETDYDPISTTTSNSTLVTADMDITQLSFSIGKTF